MTDRNNRNNPEATLVVSPEHLPETTETPPLKRGVLFRCRAKTGTHEAELEEK